MENKPTPENTPAVGSLLRFRTWQELMDDPSVSMNPNGKLFVPADGNFQFVAGPSGLVNSSNYSK